MSNIKDSLELLDRMKEIKDPALRRVLAFESIRDIPYTLRDSSYRPSAGVPRNAERLFSQGFGGCSDKASSLRAILLDDCELRLGLVEFYWKETFDKFSIRVPEVIVQKAGRLMFCFHTFVLCKIGGNWVSVDPTWDSKLAHVGFPVNVGWDGRSETQLAVSPHGEVLKFIDEEELISYRNSRYEQRRSRTGVAGGFGRRLFDEFVLSMNRWLEDTRHAHHAEMSVNRDTVDDNSGENLIA